jgi:aldehyde dehydrogenase (NAD+)
MTDTYRMLIDGQQVDAANGRTFDAIDPSTGEALATVPKGGAEDAERAVAAARAAFDEGPWPRMKGKERAGYLLKVADLAKQRAKDLAELEARDAGHTIRTAKGGDIGMIISTFRTFAEIAGREDEERVLTRVPGSMNYVRYEPIGVCVGITPWNFPVQMAAWKIAPAIAAGNAVVIKPSPYAPLSTIALAELCQEAGIPDGVVNVVTGTGVLAGEALVMDPRVDKVAFTGSTAVGRRILQMASGTVKKVTLELGGKSAAIVLDDVDLDYAADGALWGIFFNAGQVCSAGTRLLVQRSIADDLLAELVKRTDGLTVGPALDPKTDMGPIISSTQLETVERYVGIGREEGAEVLTGGERAVVEGYPGGYYFQPTILGGIRNGMRVAQEEIFGPVLAVIPFEDDAEAAAIANDSTYGLAGGIWSGDNERAMRLAAQMRTGTVWINDWHMINPRFPFGGYKQSGIGREHGEFGYREYQETKHVHLDLLGPDRSRHPWWELTLPRREQPAPAADAPGPKPGG